MVSPLQTYPWKVTPEKVRAAVGKIVEVSRPVRIIVFGSYVRGVMSRDSDLDILIVVRDPVEDPISESVRIRRALRGISMPIDVLVVPQSEWERLRNVPGTIYREAFRRGKSVYES